MDKLAKVRAEIEKLNAKLLRGACSSQIAMETMCKEEAYNEVLAILDTMQEESVSEDLDEAANTYVDNWYKLNNLDKESYPIDVEISKNDFKTGAKWQIAKLMKDAAEVTVHIDAGGYPYIPQIELYDYNKDIPLAKEGDRYKVILIKED